MGEGKATIAGAGVFGLACAWECLRRGLSVTVLDPSGPGAGASGGVVGALSPHPPAPWSAKKAAQAAALTAAPDWWAEVAAAGGVDPGYARLGRAIPLRDAAARVRAEAHGAAAAAHWPGGAGWDILDPDAFPGWIAPAAAPFGIAREGLSARLFPRAAVAALAAAVRARGGEIAAGRADRDTPGPLVLATGAAPLPGLPAGGVKGQAALLACAAPPEAPVLYDEGLYVVPQPRGMVAVGSTSEAAWSHPGPDARLDEVIARARALCPALAEAPVAERWAGVRPRAALPDPMVGPIPGWPGAIVAAGGFRTGFAQAPAVGRAVAALLAGEASPAPEGWGVPAHLAAMARKAARRGAGSEAV